MKKSISVKVLMPVILLAIVALISAFSGLFSTQTMQNQSRKLSQTTINQLLIMNEISSNFKDIDTLAYSMCVSTSKSAREEMLQEVEGLRTNITDAIARYEQTVTTDEEHESLTSLNDKYTEYSAAYDEIAGLYFKRKQGQGPSDL